MSHQTEWEIELKRQCEIRKLPYTDVHYLVSTLIAEEYERGRNNPHASLLRKEYLAATKDERTRVVEILNKHLVIEVPDHHSQDCCPMWREIVKKALLAINVQDK